jgi:hypothetical protein
MYLSTSIINNTKVSITIDANNGIYFQVGDDFEISSTNKVAITKWLLKEWKHIKERYAYLHCNPYSADGLQDYRKACFLKLGFKEEENYLAYGDITKNSIKLPYIVKEGLIVKEDIEGYFYKAVSIKRKK